MYTQPIRPHQKKKKRSAIVDRSDMMAQVLSTNVSIVLMKVSVPAEEGSNIPIMGFSLTTPYNGLLNHPPNGLFTNKFLHISINNKILSINRKEAYTISNSSTKATNNKIRSSPTK
jgi:hypothetical protein